MVNLASRLYKEVSGCRNTLRWVLLLVLERLHILHSCFDFLSGSLDRLSLLSIPSVWVFRHSVKMFNSQSVCLVCSCKSPDDLSHCIDRLSHISTLFGCFNILLRKLVCVSKFVENLSGCPNNLLGVYTCILTIWTNCLSVFLDYDIFEGLGKRIKNSPISCSFSEQTIKVRELKFWRAN